MNRDARQDESAPITARRALALALVAWTVPAVLSTSLILVRQGSSPEGIRWWPTLFGQLPSWWLWALLTPGVLSLARRLPIAGPRWGRPLMAHAGIGLAVVVAYVSLEAPFAILREGRVVTPDSWLRAILGGLSFRFITHYLIYFALVGVGHAIWASRRLRERELHASRLEAQLADARLESLKTRLQPHFLFNTLHAIGGLVREGDTDRAVRMISGLSALLRYTLDHVDRAEIPLHAELEALERYVEIEEVRFEDRLDIERRISADTTDVPVPALLLQPLVENAIRHGIERRAGASLIRIESRLEPGHLILSVIDDGAGLPQGFDLETHHGVGLGSTRRRLRELYGGQGSIDVRPAPSSGTEIVVRIPVEPTT